MNDARKTKAQLIEELDGLRQKVAAGDVSGVERQLAVERVRAAAMDMRGTDDLHKVVRVLFGEMQRLSINTPHAGINFIDESAEKIDVWLAYALGFQDLDWSQHQSALVVSSDQSAVIARWSYTISDDPSRIAIRAWRSGQVTTVERTFDRENLLRDWKTRVLTGTPENLERVASAVDGTWQDTHVPFAYGTISYHEREPVDENIDTVRALAEGLQLGYLRFLDFQQVEEQNRELTIQNALERVRSKASGMQTSDELSEVTTVLFEQFRGLGHDLIHAAIVVEDEASGDVEWWSKVGDRQIVRGMVHAPFTPGSRLHEIVEEDARARGSGAAWRVLDQGGVDLRAYVRELREAAGSSEQEIEETLRNAPVEIVRHRVFHERGLIEFALKQRLSDDDLGVAKRFTDVFDFAYSRFLELKQKEDQNRELTIQNALERVRARALEMQKSDELDEVSTVLFEALAELGLEQFWCALCLIDEDEDLFTISVQVTGADELMQSLVSIRKSMAASPNTKAIMKAFRRGEKGYDLEATGQSIQDHLEFWTASLQEKNPEYRLPQPFAETKALFQSGSFFGDGLLEVGTPHAIGVDQRDVVNRFTDVFGFAYGRYLELKQKEEQNRVLEAERSLERVRTAIAEMETSAALQDLVKVLEGQLQGLDVPCLAIAIATYDASRKVWSDNQRSYSHASAVGDLPLFLVPWIEHWSRRQTWVREYTAEQQEAQIEDMVALVALASPEVIDVHRALYPKGRCVVTTFFDHGSLSMNKPLPGAFSATDIALLERFTEVFALGYRRHLDLTAAEERARQANLDRATEHIRAEAMSMQGSEDAWRVVAALWEGLAEAGIDCQACAIQPQDDDSGLLRVYAATSDTLEQRYITGTAVESKLVRRDIVPGVHLYSTSVDLAFARERGWASQDVEASILTMPDGFPEDLRTIWGGGNYDSRLVGMHVLNVPFSHGGIVVFASFGVSFDDSDLEVSLAFADAVSFGYTRYLDFQRLEEQNHSLEIANAQVEEASLNKSQFLRRMSHDLRSPMNAIVGYSRLLQRRLSDQIQERDARNLSNIETSSGHLLNLINDILDLSRIEAGRIEIDVQSVDVRKLAEECGDALESIVKEGVELRRALTDVGEIKTDPDRLRQVAMNLLGNATKFTNTGSITLSLRSVDGGAIELSVADTGVGIPSDDLPHIFDEFRQVERQGGEQTEGTGLGLAIAKKTVDLLGGTLTADSEVGVGTTFTVRIGDYED
jgi:signal transduction histidine kinase